MSYEIEARFLEVDKKDLISKLLALGAQDKGEHLLRETIYDADDSWKTKHKRLRVRQVGDVVYLTYKEGNGVGMKTIEHEVTTSDFDKTTVILKSVGLRANRIQEKYRHSFLLNSAVIDIDTWPRVPTYVEIEASTVESVKNTAQKLGFNWNQRVEKDGYWILKEEYGIDLHSLNEFTFKDM